MWVWVWLVAMALPADLTFTAGVMLLLLWSCCDVTRPCHYCCSFISFRSRLHPPEKLDEMLAGGQQEVVLRARPSDDFRAATVKQRPTSRRITQAEINVSV